MAVLENKGLKTALLGIHIVVLRMKVKGVGISSYCSHKLSYKKNKAMGVYYIQRALIQEMDGPGTFSFRFRL